MIIAVCDPKGIAIEAIKTILYHDKGLSDRISRIYEFWNMEQLLDASRDSSFDCIVFPNYCNSHNSVVCSLSCGYNRFPLVEHCSGNTLKDHIGLRSMLDAVENNRIEAVMVRDLEQISRNSYILVGVIEILRQNDVYLITTECDLNAELINSGLERFVGDRFTRASFGKPRFDVRLPLMDQF